jgi:hypothetical protein
MVLYINGAGRPVDNMVVDATVVPVGLSWYVPVDPVVPVNCEVIEPTKTGDTAPVES